MRLVAYNNQMLENAIQDMKKDFEKYGKLNITYEKTHKEKTSAQLGFIFSAIIPLIREYFAECGYVLDNEDVKFMLYEQVADILPDMVVDNILFGGKKRIKRISDMDRELMSKFIDGVFTVLDTNKIFYGLNMHPSIYYNWAFHIEQEEINAALATKLPERDEEYLNYVRTKPCLICGIQHISEAHHLKDNRLGGISQKSPDWAAMPLCHKCHLGIAHGGSFKESTKWIPMDLDIFTRLSYLRWENIVCS